MSTDKMREEFENSPRFKGMDFQRAPNAPGFYWSPYANGAWDGWQASRAALVVDLPEQMVFGMQAAGFDNGVRECRKAIEAAGVKVKP